jgi:hypothetical protein
MFDLENMKIKQMDQLQSRRIMALQQELVAAGGRRCPAGMEFRFEFAQVNLTAKSAVIHGFDTGEQPVAFALRLNDHQHLFAYTGRDWWPAPPPQPEVHVPAGFELQWLSAQPEYREAAHIAAGNYSNENWGSARRDGDVLQQAALALAEVNPGVARWLAGKSISCYYSWTSQATSGGEGTALSYEVREDLKRMRALIESAR